MLGRAPDGIIAPSGLLTRPARTKPSTCQHVTGERTIFDRLRGERGFSLREVSRLTKSADQGGKGLSTSYLGALATGSQPPTMPALILIAEALGVAPDEFVEFRLARIRDHFDERRLGVVEAARRLEALVAAVGPRLAGELVGDRSDRVRSLRLF